MDIDEWALQQVAANSAGRAEMVEASVQRLVDALATLRGQRSAQLFGLGVAKLDDAQRRTIESAVLHALIEWKEHFARERDSVSLLALDQAARAYDIPELAQTQRAVLRCDPLGTRDGLSSEWRRRLERLDAAMAESRVDAHAIEWVGDEDEQPEVEFGAPDDAKLYAFALRYEASSGRAFPRELAAFVATADGISIDYDPTLRPLAEWSWEDEGLCIGCGGYVQGRLLFAADAEDDLLAAKIIDMDDDGEPRAEYASFGAFLDRLLGASA